MTAIILAVAIIGVTGLIGGILLSVVSQICSTGENNERLEKIRDALPGANCGSCGYAGCDSYAEAIDKGEAEPNLCSPGGAASAAALSEILGVEIDATPKAAFVKCGGCIEKASTKYNYSGLESCAAAAAVSGGPKTCPTGCIGFGDCVNSCNFNAISIKNGLATVNYDLCSGCGACAKACPKDIIEVRPKEKKHAHVICNNTQKGAISRKGCEVSCIGCGICAKKCEFDAITVENFLARVDTSKCTACGVCVSACPQKVIIIK